MKILIASLLALLCYTSSAQTKIVVLGSSTAEGVGATPYSPLPDTDSGWVNRLRLSFNKNTSDGLDTIVYNLAKGGYTTYHIMPTNYATPPNRPLPDTARNVTKAFSYDPDAIIINLPSNDIALGFSKTEIMNNFRFLFQTISSAGINAFITTTQPRDFAPNYVMMDYQRDLKDSIQANFGYFSINFWDDLVGTNPPNSLRPEVSHGDGIHINNLGHYLVFLRAAEKNLFVVNTILPLELKSFEAKIKNKKTVLSWQTLQEDDNTVFIIERSNNNTDFKTISSVPGTSVSGDYYTFTDESPLAGTSYYRLKIQGSSGTKFSPVRQVHHSNARFSIEKMLVNPYSIVINLQSEINDQMQVYLINASGNRVELKQQMLVSPVTQVKINTSQLAPGVYYMVIFAGNEFITKPVFLLK